MPNKIRPNPTIHDHEVLRKIGGGAYGEVWLARGVTGALRAVKVVWREDFEEERSFEREFEGILKFEPISRDHPALVNILHVGRSPDEVSFYYYVMELGDDVASGQDINPVEYEPRTLRADHHQATGVMWDTNDCIDVGLRLAEALDHLHERGLAHRDVKPSNVIFVNGRAKLADIGLVAARGQRTFVGTEGFVPPEGPGSAQADIYSLGKVLYEIATGKDRMSFPELPDEMPSGADRKRWLELNRIICEICEPRISKRKISTAAELVDVLRRLQRGKRRRQNGLAVVLTSLILMGFAGGAGWQMFKDSAWVRKMNPAPVPIPPQTGMLRVVSAPEGAEVKDAQGHGFGTTNTSLMAVNVGDNYFFTLKKRGYRSVTLEGKVPPTVVSEPLVLSASLEIFSPPQTGERWEDHLGNVYHPVGLEHTGVDWVSEVDWTKFLESGPHLASGVEFLAVSQNGQSTKVVLCAPGDAIAFCQWMEEGGRKAGFLTDDHEVSAIQETAFEDPGISEAARRDGLKPMRLRVRQIAYGEIKITTQPAGVEVYMNSMSDPASRVAVGSANDSLVIPKVKPGAWQLYLVCEGYKPRTIQLKVNEGEKIAKTVTLKKSQGVVFGKTWENAIGMCFAPVEQDLMVSIWETRVRDYDRFTKETGREAARAADFPQTPDHPVVNVSREDAQAFCEWLTQREQRDERIAQTHVYRVPTDLEWNAMAGLQEEEGISPGWRDARKESVYPWGETWPPVEKTGNFADVSNAHVRGGSLALTISGYDDGYAYTAPVGSFPANSYGLYDLSGNVQEWVTDDYSKLGDTPLGVLRGGGWSTYQSENLLAGSRNAEPPTFQDTIYGFRVVLAKVPPKAE